MVKLWEKRRSRAAGSEFPNRSAISLVAFLAFRSAFFNAFRASLDGVNCMFSADIELQHYISLLACLQYGNGAANIAESQKAVFYGAGG